jgi:anti-anti-sigma regulatory factor
VESENGSGLLLYLVGEPSSPVSRDVGPFWCRRPRIGHFTYCAGRRARSVSNVGVVREAPGGEWDGHVLLLHRTEDERLSGLTAWVRRGLDLGEKVLYGEVPLAPGDSLVAVLEARGVRGAAAVRDGHLAVLSVADFYPPGGQRVVVERALAEGFTAARMAAEARAALTVLSPGAVQGVEQQIAELVRTRPVHAMCQYPQATTTGAWLDGAVAAHLAGVRQSTFATDEGLDGLALRGEIDLTNGEVFAAVLTAACRSVSRVLWLDLAEVVYLDARSSWRLEDATRGFRAGGGHVLLVAARPPVEHVLRLMEVDELPGMHLLGGER